jgi:hypothetical protein
MMSKKDFVIQVRSLGLKEPNRSEWELMYSIYERNPHHRIVDIYEMGRGSLRVDLRRIPAEFKSTAVSMDELASFGSSMAEKFKIGDTRVRKNNC